ncbi:hypothetical protein HHI36_023936 [Cryptolaemus montrouzieri]|uniref:Uncharacterized protein n=1 Tax=Cryptolaemus montrouzieri TaxID=559131 RepID=A0ABD2NC16_9CUCU
MLGDVQKSNGKNGSGSIPRIRTVLGYMKSTPIVTILAESGEMPLSKRRKWLASKMITKLFSTNNQKWIEKVEELARFHGFWNNKIIPPYLAAMGKLKNYVQDKIDMSRIIKCYQVELETHFQKISY